MLHGCSQGEIGVGSELLDSDEGGLVASDDVKTVKVTAPNAGPPPFFIVSNRTGLERDIVLQAFDYAGHRAEISYKRGGKMPLWHRKSDATTQT